MRKTPTTLSLDDSVLDYISHIAEMNHVSRSKAAEIVFGLVQDYFTDQQIALEFQVRQPIDYRKKARD